ncbi:uncharacterized protein LOC131620231 [Vicia villosa]|uniref:uncharacterized protein LOC131620231 n=1 Tax=Vicia villosa TaxID=3911 RepID=UPI00273B5C83|nr:uncharacterized protein LOC131620231 [Vicia villosa]
MLAYGKACHLPVELKHKAYWAFKFLNFNEKVEGQKRLLKLDELEKSRPREYDNVVIYNERTKRYHDKNLVKKEFQVLHKVLLYNSRLNLFQGKLKSRWYGPFIVNKVFTNGAIEIKDPRDLQIFTEMGKG